MQTSAVSPNICHLLSYVDICHVKRQWHATTGRYPGQHVKMGHLLSLLKLAMLTLKVGSCLFIYWVYAFFLPGCIRLDFRLQFKNRFLECNLKSNLNICNSSCCSTRNSSFQFWLANADVKKRKENKKPSLTERLRTLKALLSSPPPSRFSLFSSVSLPALWRVNVPAPDAQTEGYYLCSVIWGQVCLHEARRYTFRWNCTCTSHSPISAWYTEHTDYQPHCRQSIYILPEFWACARKHAQTHTLWKLRNSEGGGLLYFKKHNIKIGDF